MKRYTTAILIAFVFALTLFAPAASAQPVCGSHNSITASLEKSYSEAPVAIGLTLDGGVVEVYSSSEGTWTMVITQPTGLTCLIAAGKDWENLPKSELISGTEI
ncbi:MAG: hypothetical protein HQ512_05560 [Rhodospirillales bacterium]|nr:hypothetical protein [Rhodospirillales bacterium]